MQLNVVGHRPEVTPAIRACVSSKIGRIERHFDQDIYAQVILSVHKRRQKARVTLRLSGEDLHCASSEPDRQLHRYKGKRRNPRYETPRKRRRRS